MSKICILLTSYYPINPGETFLANEIDYLTGFDKIFVCSLRGDSKRKLYEYKERKIDCEIMTFPPDNIFNVFKYTPSTIFSLDFISEIRSLYKSHRFTLHRALRALRFVSRARLAARHICKNIDVGNGDQVLLYSYWLGLSAYTGSLIKRRLNNSTRLVSRAHRADIYEYAGYLSYLEMRENIFENVDYIFPISKDGFNYLQKKYSVPPEKMQIMRLGTFDHGFSLPKKGEVLNIVSCSWMRKVKRLDKIVDALTRINFPLKWTHFGDGEEFEIISQRVKEIENGLISVDLRGSTANQDVLHEYTSGEFNVFLNVSESEGIPVSIMEAMSFGIPIIATDVGGTSDIVHDGENGFLLDKDCTYADICEYLEKIYSMDNDDYDCMCKRSRQMWESMCDGEKNYKNFCSLLHKIMDDKYGMETTT